MRGLLAALLAAAPIPTPIGAGPAYQPRPGSHEVPGLPCVRPDARRFGAHIELFANRLVVLVPAGIGAVRRPGCAFPARTTDPTGVVEVARGQRVTLGDLFAIWGRRLSRARLLDFRARPGRPVRAFVGGREWHGDLRAIPLLRHAQIVVQVRGYVPPHRTYLFPRGL